MRTLIRTLFTIVIYFLSLFKVAALETQNCNSDLQAILKKKIISLEKQDLYFAKKHSLKDKNLVKTAYTLFSDPKIINAIEKKNYQILISCGFIIHPGGALYKLRGNTILEHKNIPGWIIKFGPSHHKANNTILRIVRAQELQKFIDDNHIQNIKVPRKFLYHIPGENYELYNKNWAIFAEKIESSQKLEYRGGTFIDGIRAVIQSYRGKKIRNRTAIPDITINELKNILLHTSFCDVSWSNLKLLEDGKTIVIIDTEPIFEFQNACWSFLEHMFIKQIKKYAAIAALGQKINTGSKICPRTNFRKNGHKTFNV